MRGCTDAGMTRPALAASAATAACCAVGVPSCQSRPFATLMHFTFAFDLSEFVDGLEEGAAAGEQRNQSDSAGRGRGREAALAVANAEDEEQHLYATPTH